MGHHRLAHRGDRAVERGDHARRRDREPVVLGRELLRDQVGVAELVALAAAAGLEADRERLQPALAGLGEQRDDEARVQAPGEQDADRDVGHHAAVDRGAQRVEQGVLPVVLVPELLLRQPAVGRRPVALLRAPPVGLDDEQRGRRQLADALQDRVGRRHDAVPGEVVVQRDRVDRRVDAPAREQPGQRRAEAQRPADVREVQRLDAQAVAREQQPAALALDEGEGEHAR